ncbi:hypothetical protein BDV95DRAFT_155473 [Massariosphaeria phaeospora]|uniref:Rhodopsin domain-containing protein n=1 Tax=Massariosphaeria phaeospora TaxID=100035 RepID=A0A7C8MDE3_9PLEO|nr:hypothetical protein BDV95DRAFT_155473 [Massariosphaeria phaeospora]
MQLVTSIAIQALLLGVALAVSVLRCFIRIKLEHRALTLPDYLVWGGWVCTAGWVACSIKSLSIQIDHPLDEDLLTDSVDYLKTVFLSCYFFDFGLYFPKASLIAFYWWLIPSGFRRLRIAVYTGAAFLLVTFIATISTDTFIANTISDNWSIENQSNSTWNSYNALIINWTLNIATDLLLFGLPFFIINCLKLRRRQKIGLIGVFSLGVITMAISLARFVVYTATDYSVDDASGNLWCTAELCTATIVVSLPALKTLIVRSTPTNTSNRSTNGYMQTSSGKAISRAGGTSRSYAHGGNREDEMELTFLDRKPSLSPTGTTTGTGTQDAKDGVIVTTDVTVTRDVI